MLHYDSIYVLYRVKRVSDDAWTDYLYSFEIILWYSWLCYITGDFGQYHIVITVNNRLERITAKKKGTKEKEREEKRIRAHLYFMCVFCVTNKSLGPRT